MSKPSKVVALADRRPKPKKLASQCERPIPPPDLNLMIPAPEVWAWVEKAILDEQGPLHNPDHLHLEGADIAILWAPEGFKRQGRHVIGQAEMVSFQTSGWKRLRQEQQMEAWFGRVPAFIITLDAAYVSQCSDVEFCALVEHELYHVAQEVNEHGVPRFTESGAPKLMIRGHDVEEFIGVVARYGVGAPDGAVSRLVQAAKAKPEISGDRVTHACGTCLQAARA